MALEFAENADGSVVVKLSEPIKVGGASVARLTIPAITGRHVRSLDVPLSSAADVTIAQLSNFAAAIVEPKGAFDELLPADAIDVAIKAGDALGKGRKTGQSA